MISSSHRRVAVVTGGGRNIGRAIAMGFGREGARVVVADRDGANAAAVAEDINRSRGEAIAVGVDIGTDEAVAAMAETALQRFGRIDILVNNAARFNDLHRVPFQDIPMDEWRSVMDVNITGTFACIRAVTPQMRRQQWGRIVNISSGSIRMGRPDFMHYVTSKSALIGMTRSLARELGPFGITANVVLPGVVFTADQKQSLTDDYQAMVLRSQCIPEPLAPDAIVGPVLFLCSDAARYVTGQQLAVDGGLTYG